MTLVVLLVEMLLGQVGALPPSPRYAMSSTFNPATMYRAVCENP
jgi:hypothetical protein